MGIVEDLRPLNLREEKEKFLNDTNYNPQFRYVRKFSTAELTKWGMPNPEIMELSKRMVRQGLESYNKGHILTEDYVGDAVSNLLDELSIAELVTVSFTKKQVSRCRVNEQGISFRLPIEFDNVILGRIMRHEIETHLLRRLNEKKQPWRGEGKDIAFRQTEEGLAYLNGFAFGPVNMMQNLFVKYVAVGWAMEGGFGEVFRRLQETGLSERLAWHNAIRVKRGMTDTSKPGGVTKSLTYLEGAVKMWRWLKDEQHDPHDLYWGRISLESIDKRRKAAVNDDLFKPTFFEDMDAYRGEILQLGLVNNFGELRDE